MHGGLERWKRGVDSRGVRQAIAYALEGTCDAHRSSIAGVDALEKYADASDETVTRFIVDRGEISHDELTAGGLRVWITGHDPITGEERGRSRLRPDADLLLDGTINHPKTYSVAALLYPELAVEYEALQDRLRDRILLIWQSELNARRGHNGLIREDVTRIEVVELQHRRSRALDPHIHRHLWLNIKVLGADGRWTNLDSRVAMKLHTVINAEGELAARTDPGWVATLARHGYTLNEAGEIAELPSAVRPLSRRSAQIERNRARLIAEWSTANGGAVPSFEVLQQIDRRSWATARPNKSAHLDEESWEATVRDEIAAIDAALLAERAAVDVTPVHIDDLDLDLLAATAVVDADERSTSSSGRFSAFDLRAGATRALSHSGIVAERAELDSTIADIARRAQAATRRLIGGDVPLHVKAFMANSTVIAKIRIGARFDALAKPGRSLLAAELHRAAPSEGELEESQGAAHPPSRARTDSSPSSAPPAPARRRCCASRSTRSVRNVDGCSSWRQRARLLRSHLGRSAPRHPACTRSSRTTGIAGRPTSPARRSGHGSPSATLIVLRVWSTPGRAAIQCERATASSSMRRAWSTLRPRMR
jgi:exodeoxyribonuclease V alpha subunit